MSLQPRSTFGMRCPSRGAILICWAPMPTSSLTRIGLARFSSCSRTRARIDPLLLRLALAERRLGARTFDEHLALLQDRFDAARRRGDSVHLREEARFTLHLLDRPGEALELARRNWATQREPADARVLLEAALAASQPAAAQPVLDWLDRTGLEHVGIEALVDRLAETS